MSSEIGHIFIFRKLGNSGHILAYDLLPVLRLFLEISASDIQGNIFHGRGYDMVLLQTLCGHFGSSNSVFEEAVKTS